MEYCEWHIVSFFEKLMELIILHDKALQVHKGKLIRNKRSLDKAFKIIDQRVSHQLKEA